MPSNAGALRLHEHGDQLEVALAWLDEHEDEVMAAGGVLPPELEELLDQAEGSFDDKVGRTTLVVHNLLANAVAAKAEAERLGGLAAGYARRAELLKAYVQSQMLRVGRLKVESPLGKAWIQKNGRPSVRLANPDQIPEAFRRVRVEFDGQAAYEHLKACNAIPEPEDGPVEIEGLIVERGVHLRLK